MKKLAKQEIGVLSVSIAELFERFSYYGTRVLLIFFLMHTAYGVGIDESIATSVAILFGVFGYVSTMFGGWLSDRFFGMQKTIIYGGWLLVISRVLLSIQITNFAYIIFTLFLMCLGVGFFKGNINSFLGTFYKDGDTSREIGFSILYSAIQIGSITTPLIIGGIGQSEIVIHLNIFSLILNYDSYHLSFLLTAIASLFTVLFFIRQKNKYFPQNGLQTKFIFEKSKQIKILILICIPVIAIIAIVNYLLTEKIISVDVLIKTISFAVLLIPVGIFINLFLSQKVSPGEKKNVLAYLPYFIGLVFFFGIESSTATIFLMTINDNCDTDIFGIQFPSSMFFALFPAFVLLFLPIVAPFWKRFSKFSFIFKSAFSVLLSGVAFIIIAIVLTSTGNNVKFSILWVFLVAIILGFAEATISPLGLATTTILAPKAFQGQMISLYFFGEATGSTIMGLFTNSFTSANKNIPYFIFGVIVVFVGVVLFLLNKPITKLLKKQ